MAFVFANMTITAIAVTLILLSLQAEAITATIGYFFAGVLVLAVIRQTLGLQRGNDAGRPDTTNDQTKL